MTELTAITDDRIREIAAEHGVSLCDSCNQPRDIHVSCDHKTGVCGLDSTGFSLGIRYPDKTKCDEAVVRLNRYFADLISADQAAMQKGAAI